MLCLASGLVGTKPVVISGSYDGAVRLWSADAGLQLESTLQSEQGATFSLAAAGYPDGSCAVMAGSHSRRLSLWLLSPPLAEIAVAGPLHSNFLHTGWVRSVALEGARRGAKHVSRTHTIGCNRILSWPLHSIWSEAEAAASLSRLSPLAPESELAVFEEGEDGSERSHDILCVAHGDEEEMLVSGSIDGAIRAWSTRGVSHASQLEPTPPAWWMTHAGERVTALAFHRGALLSCGYDGWVRRWRCADLGAGGGGGAGGVGGALRWEMEAEAQPVAKRDAARDETPDASRDAAMNASTEAARGAVMDAASDEAMYPFRDASRDEASAGGASRLTSLTLSPCVDDPQRACVHVGTSCGQVVCLDAETLSILRTWRLPPLPGPETKAVRVTALSAVAATGAGGGAGVIVAGDSVGRLHIAYSPETG